MVTLPCPYDGCDRVEFHVPKKRTRHPVAYAYCTACGARGPLGFTETDARRYWNQRFEIPKPIELPNPTPEEDKARSDILHSAVQGLKKSIYDISDFISVLEVLGDRYDTH